MNQDKSRSYHPGLNNTIQDTSINQLFKEENAHNSTLQDASNFNSAQPPLVTPSRQLHRISNKKNSVVPYYDTAGGLGASNYGLNHMKSHDNLNVNNVHKVSDLIKSRNDHGSVLQNKYNSN